MDLPAPEIIAAPVQPEAALAFWAWKSGLPWPEVQKMDETARLRAFYVTGLAEHDAVAAAKDALRQALENGETLKDFQARIADVIHSQGWQGWRVENIFRTNLQAAYMAGRWAKMEQVKKIRPYRQYFTVGDDRVRPSHAILNGMVYPADHEFWDVNQPPNGFRCRCGVRSLSARQVERQGLTVQTEMPGDSMLTDPKTGMEVHVANPGADFGWRNNPGKAWLAGDATAGLPLDKYPDITPPKKEPLTQKKLQDEIAALDAQMKDMSDKQKLTQLEAKKAEYQKQLEKKELTAKRKKLTREKAALQKELDSLAVKTYSGIWLEDVTTADWKAKSGSIHAKREYFRNKLAEGGLAVAELEKIERLLKDLDEFAVEGERYHEIESTLKKVRQDLAALKKGGRKGEADPFSEQRKEAALWAKDPQEADDVMRGPCGEVWKKASAAERDAIYHYTGGSGGFNRPLRGYEGDWYKFKGMGKVDLNYEGRGDAIAHMTKLIDRSSYDKDIWLQRGIETPEGAASFLGISAQDLRNMTQDELKKRLNGEKVTDAGFISCGSAKGKGFNGYIFNIYCPKGTKMMYSEPFSAYGEGGKRKWDGISKQSYFGFEDETIIQRGTTFRVIKVEKQGDNIYFDLEVIKQIGGGQKDE
ncbi:MAG: minor capsid protein [Desulfovibrio sp.]|nr:minor capsid protein [Desulfovibrio sp.]